MRSAPVRLLILGGTSWLGGAVAEEALRAGHDVTCVARGVSGPVPPGARLVRVDRWKPDALRVLDGSTWDAAVEVSWQPALVRRAVEALRGRVRQWAYVSSVSVYAGTGLAGGDETDPTLPGLPVDDAPAAPEDYGSAKVACETILAEHLDPGGLMVARAGLIVGHGDRSDRFGYWPGRFAGASGLAEVLVPPSDTPVQGIDVRDLATWLVRASRDGTSGTMDVVGEQWSMADVLDACRAATDGSLTAREVSHDWLQEAGVRPWAGPESLPLWLPVEAAGLATRRGRRARAAGLTHRSLQRTIEDSLRWEVEQGLGRERAAGLTTARESTLLARLRG